MDEQPRQKGQCSTADTRGKVEGASIPGVSQFKLMAPKENSDGHETKRSALESCSIHSHMEEDQSLFRREVEQERKLQHLMRKQAVEYGMGCVFEAFDGFMEEFRKLQQGSSALTERSTSGDLFAKLKGELRAALFDQLSLQPHYRDDSENSSFVGSSQYDMMVQLRTIQELREHVDDLEGQLCEKPISKSSIPVPPPVLYPQSIKRSVLLESLQSPCYNTFDKDNCQSFAEFGSANYYPIQDSSHPAGNVERWSGEKFVRQFDIKVQPINRPQAVLCVPNSIKKAFRSVMAIYKRLFRRYLQSVATSWKVLSKLVRVVRQSMHQFFVVKGKALLKLIKGELNRVDLWYGSLQLRITGFSYGEMEQFMTMCQQNLTYLSESKDQINGLLMELPN